MSEFDKSLPSLPGTELYGDRYFSGPYSTAQFSKEEDDLYERIRANLPTVLSALSHELAPGCCGKHTINGHCTAECPERPCATCDDKPEVCATVPGLRHCEKATRESAPSSTRLTKHAQVGNTIFNPGISVDLLISRAEREYEYQQTPEMQAERKERRDAFIASVQAGCQDCSPVTGCPNPNLCAVTKQPVAPSASRTPDSERMDWLERFSVEVRQPLVHGSHHLFYAKPEAVEGADDEPSNIREQIDYQRNGGKKPGVRVDGTANTKEQP